MSLRKKTSRNRKQKKRIASSSEKWIRRVIHYGDNGVPYLHEAAHYPERVSPNPDWTSCLLCLTKMVDSGVLDESALDFKNLLRRRNASRSRPV